VAIAIPVWWLAARSISSISENVSFQWPCGARTSLSGESNLLLGLDMGRKLQGVMATACYIHGWPSNSLQDVALRTLSHDAAKTGRLSRHQ
jgi:hypothetical protein